MGELAAGMGQLRSFLHVSTAYVNCFLGRGVHVEERQYTLPGRDGQTLVHADVADELAALTPEAAERRVRSPASTLSMLLRALSLVIPVCTAWAAFIAWMWDDLWFHARNMSCLPSNKVHIQVARMLWLPC